MMGKVTQRFNTCSWHLGILTLLLGVALSHTAYANLNTEISQVQLHAQAQSEQYHIDADQLVHMVKSQSSYQQGTQYAAGQSHPDRNPQGYAHGVIVFVSLSMPDKLLRQTLIAAHQYHVPVVVRGLVDNDMRKTLQCMFTIIHPKGSTRAIKGGFEINPLWFRAFNITAVPAVVAISGGGNCYGAVPCPERHYDVIYGNISLKSALEQIAREGEAKSVARWVLDQGSNSHA